MIAYDSQQLDQQDMQQHAREAHELQLITTEEYQRVLAAYPVSMFTPNAYIRLGLYLLTCIVMFGVWGLSFVFFNGPDSDGIGILLLMLAFGSYVTLELVFIRAKQHYRSGVDDALLWISGAFFFIGIVWLTQAYVSGLTLSAILFAVSAFFALRFADGLMMLVSFLSLLSLLFYGCLELEAIGKTIAPFVLMIASFAVYFILRRLLKIHACRHYTGGLNLVAMSALIISYLAGNYFIVREVGSDLLGETLSPGQGIPAGWLFWVFTVLIPLVYIFFGVRKKDRILIWSGVLLIAAIVFTIRYYHSIMPVETAMVIAGILLIGIAYALIKYLHRPKQGFGSQPPLTGSDIESLQLESLVIAEAFQQTPAADDPGFQFRGGSGGGAGASGDF